jgi:hypothetical protein
VHPGAPHPGEVDDLIEAARGNRYGHRDATMILLTYRHGLRAAEVCDLRWDQVGAVPHVSPAEPRFMRDGHGHVADIPSRTQQKRPRARRGQSTGNKVPEGDNVIPPRSRLLEVFVAVLAVHQRDRQGRRRLGTEPVTTGSSSTPASRSGAPGLAPASRDSPGGL